MYIVMPQNEIYLNNLYARVDWLEFTVTDYQPNLNLLDNVAHYLGHIGLHIDLFDVCGKGGMGYRATMRHVYENVFVFYDGASADMGIHIRVSGSSVNYVLSELLNTTKCDTPFGIGYDVGDYGVTNVLPMFIERVLEVGHFTRIDLAIDDVGINYYKVSEVVEKLESGCLVSKFKKSQNVVSDSVSVGRIGHTLYLGSRESDVFLRVYEKGLEQNVSFDWVRWELEIKHEKADVVARQLLEKQNFGFVAIGVLKNYVKIVLPDNARRTRCSLDPKWIEFTGEVEKLRLSLSQKESSYDDKVNWIKKQCLPTLAGIIYAQGGDMSIISDDLEVNFDRLKARDKVLFKRKLEECLNDSK